MHKILRIIILAILSVPLFSLSAFGEEEATEQRVENKDWLKIYYKTNGVRRINAHPVSDLDSVVYHRVPMINDVEMRLVTVFPKNSDLFAIGVEELDSMVLGGNIPTLYIDTDPYVNEITSKTEYTTANFRYVPYGDGSDTLEQIVSIRGRGNTSWNFPKKPYRLKFEKKQAIGGLNKAKSFVLISNYIDNTLMKNAVAFKIAEMLDMPYTNKVIPVNLVFNGMERGSYILTNKVGINAGSVDIDEKEGILWELDTYFDEEFKFRSSKFNLPCMVKDPDIHEIANWNPEKEKEIWAYWKNDLEDALQAVEDGRWQEVFDAEQFVKYILVQNLVLNREVNHPKSLYLYKENSETKYKLGPVWDFDWAFNYTYNVEDALFKITHDIFPFFEKIFKDEEFQNLFREYFERFCEEHLAELYAFIDDYAALIRDSAIADAMRWPAKHYYVTGELYERNTSMFDENVVLLKIWLSDRVEIIRNSKTFNLY